MGDNEGGEEREEDYCFGVCCWSGGLRILWRVGPFKRKLLGLPPRDRIVLLYGFFFFWQRFSIQTNK